MGVRSLGQEGLLEKDMVIHSSVLAWEIPWTEEPGGLQSIELQGWTRLKQLSTHTDTRNVTGSFIWGTLRSPGLQ